MGTKKRTSLRAKASKRQGKGASGSKGVTKKVLQNKVAAAAVAAAAAKAISSAKKLDGSSSGSTSGSTSGSILDKLPPTLSKSSLRRRKRKLKEQLNAKLSDLEAALDEPGPETVKLDHTPRANTSKGKRRVERAEEQRFHAVLKEKKFQASPFDALKAAIIEREANTK